MELSAVIVLLAVLAAVIVPRLPAIRASQDAINFRNQLLNLSEFARESAIENQRTATLRFDENNNFVYELAEDEDETSLSDQQLEEQLAQQSIPIPENVDFIIYQTANTEVNQEDWQCAFYANGSADRASLEFEQNGRPYHFVISAEQGLSRVFEGRLVEVEPDTWPAGDIEVRGTQ